MVAFIHVTISVPGPGERFKNTYELLKLRALKFSLVNEIHIFKCMGNILYGNSKVPFEITHKISYPYSGRYDFYTTFKF